MALVSDKDSETEVYDNEKEADERSNGINDFVLEIKLGGKIYYVIVDR